MRLLHAVVVGVIGPAVVAAEAGLNAGGGGYR